LEDLKGPLLILFFAFTMVVSAAQDVDIAKKQRPGFNISLNMMGDASLISLGFEKLFFVEPNLALAAKVGFGWNQEFQLFSSESLNNYFILPHHFTANIGKGRSFVELGLGAALVTDNREYYYVVYPMAGYRYHPFKNPGLSFRAWMYYPFAQKNFLDGEVIMLIPVGVSVGIAL
jgi:hypothetical protein